MDDKAQRAYYSHVRDIVKSNKGRFTSVTFIKKDGSKRTITTQPASAKFHIKGEDANEQAQRAAETRAARHPNLLNLYETRKGEFRSANMDTLIELKCSGRIYSRKELEANA